MTGLVLGHPGPRLALQQADGLRKPVVWQAVCDHDRAAPALPSCAANSLVWVMAALRQRRQGVGRRGEGSGAGLRVGGL